MRNVFCASTQGATTEALALERRPRCRETATPCGRPCPSPSRMRSKRGQSPRSKKRASSSSYSAAAAAASGLFAADTVDVRPAAPARVEHRLARHAVVALRMIGRHVALVAPEEMDRVPRQAIAERIARRDAVERARRRAAGERPREAAVARRRPRAAFTISSRRGVASARRRSSKISDLTELGDQFRHLLPSFSISSSASFGPQRAGRVVGEVARRERLPDVEDRRHDAPARLHHVAAVEERRVAESCSRRAASRSRCAAGCRSSPRSRSPSSPCRAASSGPGTLASKRSEMPSSGWMWITSRLGFSCSTGRVAEEHERRALELDRDLGDALRQALAGAQVERHAGPAPVVDEQLERHEGLGRASPARPTSPRGSAGTRLPSTSPAPYWPRTVWRSTSSGEQRTDRRQHLHPLVAHGVGARTRSAAPSRPARGAGTCGSAPCRAARRPPRSSRRAPRRPRSRRP